MSTSKNITERTPNENQKTAMIAFLELLRGIEPSDDSNFTIVSRISSDKLFSPDPTGTNDFLLDLQLSSQHGDLPLPIVTSKKGDEEIVTYVFAIINSTKPLQQNQFHLYHNFSFNEIGLLQLDYYIKFDDLAGSPVKLPSQEYFLFKMVLPFNLENKLLLKGIETINVSLFRSDPGTSRGTTTTVQSGTGGNV